MKSFRVRMAIRAQEFADSGAKLVRKVAFVVDQTLVMGTPIDTGRARSNWIVGVDHEPSKTTKSVNPAAALAQGAAEISRFKHGDLFIAIVNNLEYIRSLEEGSSVQAPEGMIKQAISAGEAARASARLL